jgi:hypothetical protein
MTSETSRSDVPVVVGTCECGGYGVLYDEVARRATGRCHDTPESLRERNMKRAAEHTERITRIEAAGAIKAEAHNDGHRLKLSRGYLVVDFWLASGLWSPRGVMDMRRNGLDGALRFLGVEETDDNGE